jgi:ribosomal protein S12 methylthiotransferase accessory factor YcaO
MARTGKPINYRLELTATAESTGYFGAVPETLPSFEEGLAYLRRHPNDSFMVTHLLECVGEMSLPDVSTLLDSAEKADTTIRVLILEAATVYDHLAVIKKRFTRREMNVLAGQTPLVFLRSELRSGQRVHRSWAQLFHANMTRHRPLPPPAATGFPFPVDGVDGSDDGLPAGAHLKAIVERCLAGRNGSGTPRPPLETTIARALERISSLNCLEGTEMRHQASLSPCALMRKWRFNHRVTIGGLDYSLSSIQTSYGRGLSLDAARASCLMEVAERCSSFASVDETGIVGTRHPHPILHGRRSQWVAGGYPLLDPNVLGLEVPYRDEPLYWMEGKRLTRGGVEPIWVPVQCVFLFCNLDERSLFSGLGSTGLASGNSMAEARLRALYEVIERDSEAVNPYHPSRCFRISASDARVKAILDDYRARGIHVQFQDISPAFGIPCCTCFVTHRDGTVAKGGGSNLDGKQAVLSAMTETPYPYPDGPPSSPAPPDLPWLEFEALPDFSTGMPDLDLMLVEETLIANGFSPIYVDISRKDLDIPVVKALVPGFEMMADFDQYCRISPRLFNNYLKIHK